MTFIFIDESGDLGKKSRYFVISAILIDDDKKLERVIKKIYRKYKKEIGESNEIKGIRTPPHIKKKIYQKLNNNKYTVYSIVFDKINRYKLDYKYSNNELYNVLAGELAKLITINNNTKIIIDKSKSKKEDILNFNQIFMNNLINPNKHLTHCIHVNSIHYKGLQIIDLITWSIFQYYENKDVDYINLIKNKTIKTVFED